MEDSKPKGSRTVNGIVWMIAGQGGQTLFQFVLFMVLARTLLPEAFGIIAVATALLDISNYIGRFGLTEVLIQRRVISDTDEDTAFWASAGFGLLLMLGLFFSADHLAVLFAMPALAPVLKILSPYSLLFAVGAVYEAKLRRLFGFKQLAMRNVSATFISGVVSMTLALTGAGVFSLVAQRLVFVFWQLGAMILSTRWIPGLRYNARVCMGQLRDGFALAMSSLLGVGNQRVIDLIVGYFLGSALLGYLRIAWRGLDLLLELSIRPVMSVTLTSLSRLQDDPAALKDAYLRLMAFTSVFAYPIFFGALILAPEIITLLFGNQWAQSVVLMQILTLTGVFVPLIYYKSNLLMAVGNMRGVLLLNIVEFALSAGIAAIFSRYGVESAAAGNVVRMLVVTPIILGVIAWLFGLPVGRQLRSVAPALGASLIMLGVLFVLRTLLGDMLGPIANVALFATLGCLIYGSAMFLLDRRTFLTMFGMVRDLASKVRKTR